MRLEGEDCVRFINKALMVRRKVDEARSWFDDFTDMEFGASLQQRVRKRRMLGI